MLTRTSELLKKYAKGWLIFGLLALEVLFSAVIVPGIRAELEAVSGGTGFIDLQFFYTPEKAYTMISSYGDVGRTIYRTFELTTDIAHPVIYALLFSLLISWLFRRGLAANSQLQLLNIVPLGAWLFDLLENVSIVSMLLAYPSAPDVTAWLATVFTMIKWCFVSASIALVLAGFVLSLKNGFKKQ
ncbi:hypothetical protein [Ralstonia pseudosolanacearum]|uniref:hypothetical protein n=1 Tax=Ralstonia pseudosolanacearum TaxID=1310165 RepID=UPI0026752395|nr:hypothetical protein [Ralstonia pseudosolanacearum]MDO3526388.1 hypothetical protein [Ralstonia pseudosolanacearum]